MANNQEGLAWGSLEYSLFILDHATQPKLGVGGFWFLIATIVGRVNKITCVPATHCHKVSEDNEGKLAAKDARFDELYAKHEALKRENVEALDKKDRHHVQVKHAAL